MQRNETDEYYIQKSIPNGLNIKHKIVKLLRKFGQRKSGNKGKNRQVGLLQII